MPKYFITEKQGGALYMARWIDCRNVESAIAATERNATRENTELEICGADRNTIVAYRKPGKEWIVAWNG